MIFEEVLVRGGAQDQQCHCNDVLKSHMAGKVSAREGRCSGHKSEKMPFKKVLRLRRRCWCDEMVFEEVLVKV